MNELIFKNNNKVGIVFTEAGGSNLIISWILKHRNLEYIYCVNDTAKKLFEKKITNFVNSNLDEIINKCDVLITGTTLYSKLEHQARFRAKEKKIMQVGVLDHWVNYEGCFTRNEETVLPNIIWVFDKYAERKAINIFKEVAVKRQTNYYLKSIVKKIKNLDKRKKKFNQNNILYVLEPIQKDNKFLINHEFKVLDYFLDNLYKLKLKNMKIKLRPHPSDPDNKYDNWLKYNNQNINISISKDQSLENDIAWSDIVVGYDTYALVIAKASSKRCITSIPKGERNCSLMIKDIEYLRDMK